MKLHDDGLFLFCFLFPGHPTLSSLVLFFNFSFEQEFHQLQYLPSGAVCALRQTGTRSNRRILFLEQQLDGSLLWPHLSPVSCIVPVNTGKVFLSVLKLHKVKEIVCVQPLQLSLCSVHCFGHSWIVLMGKSMPILEEPRQSILLYLVMVMKYALLASSSCTRPPSPPHHTALFEEAARAQMQCIIPCCCFLTPGLMLYIRGCF